MQDKTQSATTVRCYVNTPQHIQGRNVICWQKSSVPNRNTISVCTLDPSDTEQLPKVDSSKHGNVPSDSINAWNFVSRRATSFFWRSVLHRVCYVSDKRISAFGNSMNIIRYIHTRICESDRYKIKKKKKSFRTLVSFCTGEKHPPIKRLL